MGMPLFSSCGTNYEAPAPNPSPSRWVLLDKAIMENAYVLKVKYLDATNFEGVKIMVYEGKYVERQYLDPHFADNDLSPVARFRPDAQGWRDAIGLAVALNVRK